MPSAKATMSSMVRMSRSRSSCPRNTTRSCWANSEAGAVLSRAVLNTVDAKRLSATDMRNEFCRKLSKARTSSPVT